MQGVGRRLASNNHAPVDCRGMRLETCFVVKKRPPEEGKKRPGGALSPCIYTLAITLIFEIG